MSVARRFLAREILHFLSETLDVDADWLSGNGGNAVNLETSPRRTFSKSTKLDNVLYDVRGPVVDEANRMERNGTHILKLNIGNPLHLVSEPRMKSSMI